MKKFISVVLCVIMFISILSLSAYADGDFLLHRKGTEGILSTGVKVLDDNGGQITIPKNSSFKLAEDLYSDDTYILVNLYHSELGWLYSRSVCVEFLYFFPDHVRSLEDVA